MNLTLFMECEGENMKNEEVKHLDLIVERYQFSAGKEKTELKALLTAASSLESMLYHAIYGGLQFDLRKRPITYPDKNEVEDDCGVAKFRVDHNFHINPFLLYHEDGINGWAPLDGLQKFDFRIELKKRLLGGYRGVIHLTAFVWDDGEHRNGCLYDLVDRYHGNLLIGETGTIAIPMDSNKKEDISGFGLLWNEKKKYWEICGPIFPPDEEGDISHHPIKLIPIDIKTRIKGCAYRDR